MKYNGIVQFFPRTLAPELIRSLAGRLRPFFVGSVSFDPDDRDADATGATRCVAATLAAQQRQRGEALSASSLHAGANEQALGRSG